MTDSLFWVDAHTPTHMHVEICNVKPTVKLTEIPLNLREGYSKSCMTEQATINSLNSYCQIKVTD